MFLQKNIQKKIKKGLMFVNTYELQDAIIMTVKTPKYFHITVYTSLKYVN